MKDCVILHVEDDDASAFILQAAVNEAGLETSIYRVSDGGQALLYLRKQAPYEEARTPKLVLLDLNLPGISGWEVLAKLQTDPALQEIPVIVMSTGAAAQHAAKALASGARHYLQKAGSFDELVRQVQTHCEMFVTSRKR